MNFGGSKEKRKLAIVLMIVVIVAMGSFILVKKIDTTNRSGADLKQKGKSIFGEEHCVTDHSLEFGGTVLSRWKCKLCRATAINSTTNTPELCETCARITGRCSECAKLK